MHAASEPHGIALVTRAPKHFQWDDIAHQELFASQQRAEQDDLT